MITFNTQQLPLCNFIEDAPLKKTVSQQKTAVDDVVFPLNPLISNESAKLAGRVKKVNGYNLAKSNQKYNPIIASKAGQEKSRKKEKIIDTAVRNFSSPKRYYPVDSNLKVKFSPGAKEFKRGDGLIYKIKHVETCEAKIGMTYQSLSERTSQHLSCARHGEKDRGKSDLYNAMRRSPTKFRVGVVKKLNFNDASNIACQPKELGKLEIAAIEDHGTLVSGFNKNRGGGGGAIAREKVNLDPKDFSFDTPKKEGYPIRTVTRKINGEKKSILKVICSPGAREKTRVVYGFRRDDDKWFIGQTDQSLQERMYGYHTAFNHPEKDVGKRPLAEAVRAEPERWRVHTLYQGLHNKEMEKLWIKAKNSIENGFNQIDGGGGPAGQKYT